eukprot:Awhi_evm1s7678
MDRSTFNNYGDGEISCDIFDIGCAKPFFFFGPLRITYIIRLGITYPSTLNNLSTISNLVSTSNYTSTNTWTYSSRVIIFIFYYDYNNCTLL